MDQRNRLGSMSSLRCLQIYSKIGTDKGIYYLPGLYQLSPHSYLSLVATFNLPLVNTPCNPPPPLHYLDIGG